MNAKVANILLSFLLILVGSEIVCAEAPAGDGLALTLDGVNDYASAPDADSLDLGVGAGNSFTLECFFHLPVTNRLGYASLITKAQGYELGLLFDSNTTILNFSTAKIPGSLDVLTGVNLKPGRHHVAAVFANSTNPTVRTLFLDGRRVYRDTFANFPSGINAVLSAVSVGGAYGTNSFKGWLDEVRISNMARYTNDSPISTHDTPYRIPKTPFVPDVNTVALWHFDENTGTANFADASSNSNHLASSNGVTTSAVPVSQNAGTLDQSFDPGLGVASDLSPNGVYAMVVLTNGQIIVGGQFTTVDGQARTNLARLNSDGSVDSTFNLTFASDFSSSSINAVVLLPDGQMLIGGRFSAVNGTRRTGLARLNQDGSVDATFPAVLTGAADSVSAMARQPDGKIIIFGSFARINGLIRPNAARLNANGTIDPSFNAGNSAVAYSGVKRIILQPDGKLLCNVSQYNFSTQLSTNLVRLNSDGVLDNSFQPVLADFPLQQSIALQPDGKALLVGYFKTINGTARVGAARFLTNGALDTAFSLMNSHGTIYTNGGTLDFVAVQPDGKILLGGAFYTAPHSVIPSVARFLPDGTFDTSFQPAEFYVPNNRIYASAFLPSGNLLIGGEFIDLNGYSRQGIARLHGDRLMSPRFLSITPLPLGVVRLDVTNPASMPLVLLSTTNLIASDWQSIATNSLTTNQCRFLHTNPPPSTSRFYQTLLLGP